MRMNKSRFINNLISTSFLSRLFALSLQLTCGSSSLQDKRWHTNTFFSFVSHFATNCVCVCVTSSACELFACRQNDSLEAQNNAQCRHNKQNARALSPFTSYRSAKILLLKQKSKVSTLCCCCCCCCSNQLACRHLLLLFLLLLLNEQKDLKEEKTRTQTSTMTQFCPQLN